MPYPHVDLAVVVSGGGTGQQSAKPEDAVGEVRLIVITGPNGSTYTATLFDRDGNPITILATNSNNQTVITLLKPWPASAYVAISGTPGDYAIRAWVAPMPR